MLTLSETKNYIRATYEDDDLVQALMDASESYLQGAIDNYTEKYSTATPEWQKKADLAKKLLIADWYENRTPTERPISPAVRLIITQLQLAR